MEALELVQRDLHQGALTQRRSVRQAPAIVRAGQLLAAALQAGRRGYAVGNGGSAADAQHFAAEFTGRFRLDRRPLPLLALTADTSVLTAVVNDYGAESIFERQVAALAVPGDVLVAISTSGRSPNVLAAARAARVAGAQVIALTGAEDCPLAASADVWIRAASTVTARVQEFHILALHAMCTVVEHALDLPVPDELRLLPAVTTVEALAQQRVSWRQSGLSVVTTNGCFDLLHAGHLQSLRTAADLGDVLVVLVNDDASVRALKGDPRPYMPLAARLDMLAGLECVDHVAAFGESDPTAALTRLRPDVHAKGFEYAARCPLPEEEAVVAGGGRVEYLPMVEGISTTDLVRRISGSG